MKLTDDYQKNVISIKHYSKTNTFFVEHNLEKLEKSYLLKITDYHKLNYLRDLSFNSNESKNIIDYTIYNVNKNGVILFRY